jgi:hypothetical protein
VRSSTADESDSAPTAPGRSTPLNHVLVDSFVWVAHFRKPDRVLQSLLTADRVLCHPMIVIEIACATPPAPAFGGFIS